MLIYVESKAFPSKTFTLVCNPHDTIARARAQMLHILYELGRAEHQFRFRFKGEYLRDAYIFEDYKILDNSVIKMVPMSKKIRGSFANVFGSKPSIKAEEAEEEILGRQEVDDVQKALRKEVSIFDKRESLLLNFKVLLWMHFLVSLLAFSTNYWYSGVWTGLLTFFGFIYCPTYTRLGGFVGKHGMNKKHFLVFYLVGAFMNLIAALLMGVYMVFLLLAYDCNVEEDSCLRSKEKMHWSIILYFTQGLLLVGSILVCVLLLYNFKIEIGDLIEMYLVQTRDIDKVMKSAKVGSVKERRHAAFELASLAATGDDTKFRIVDDGGLEALMSMCLLEDQATQEYATEAIAELLTVPAIQDQFKELGGIRTLCALLRSKNPRVVNEAVTALSYIVADSEANRVAVLSENGMEDLAYIAERSKSEKTVQSPASRIVAGIFLELAFSAEIRVMMSSQTLPASALVHLCKQRDTETRRLSLQTLELLAIENPDVIVTNDSLLDFLLDIPNLTDDEQLFLLSGKILLYYAENDLACQKLCQSEDLKPCLMEFVFCEDPLLLNVVAKVVLAILEAYDNKEEIASLGLDEVLLQVKSESSDRDAWNMADHGLRILHNFEQAIGRKSSLLDESPHKADPQRKVSLALESQPY